MSAVVEPVTIEIDAARQFDFWVGEWDCTWSDEHEWHAGTNSVYLDLGGAVVVESFDGRPSLEYQGLSFSVYDRAARCWRHTWVDSEGSYLDFAGSFENGAMELRRIGEVDGAPALFRARWENIERDSLDWSYQCSHDGGEAGRTLWAIAYHVSFSWVDPHFAVLYARREEERLEERLAASLRERAASCEPRVAALRQESADGLERLE